MEKHNEPLENPDLSKCDYRISDSNLEDDAEDYIQPSQPLSFQASNLESVSKKSFYDKDLMEMNASTIYETLSLPKSVILTPTGDTTNDFIPESENPKRKIDGHGAPVEDSCIKRLNLDDTSPLKTSPDLFSTQPDPNDTVDVAQLKVRESPFAAGSQNVSLVPETPFRINETLDSESSIVLSESSKCRVLQETIAEDSPKDTSVDLCEFDTSGNERFKSSVCDSRDDIKVMETSKTDRNEVLTTDPSPRLLDTDVSVLQCTESGGDVVNDKKMETQLDDTVDVEEIEYYNPHSSIETDKKITVESVPPLTEGLISPMEPEAESTPIDKNPSKEGLMLKSVLKNISEESSGLQKHSTPENPLSKSLKINESTSSIENGTPPVQDDILKSTEITFTVLLQVNCQVIMDPIKNEPITKKIMNVKEVIKKQPKQIFLEPYSDSSCKTKRLSSSSAGSVYSEKTGLPYALPGRPSPVSGITESSSTSSLDLAKHNQIAGREVWTNEYLLPMAIDEILPRYMEQQLRSAQRNDGNAGGKRKVSLRIRKKSHWSHPLNSVLESSTTEQSSGNISDVQLPGLEKSEEPKSVKKFECEESKSDSLHHVDQEKEMEPADVTRKEVTPVKQSEGNESVESIMSEELLTRRTPGMNRWSSSRAPSPLYVGRRI